MRVSKNLFSKGVYVHVAITDRDVEIRNKALNENE